MASPQAKARRRRTVSSVFKSPPDAPEGAKVGDVRVIVACDTGDGPDLAFVIVRCREDQYHEGDHYTAAESWATGQGYEPPMVSFDEFDPAGKAIVRHFVWESAWTVSPRPDVAA